MSVIIRLQNLPMSANASNIRRFFAGLAIPEGGVHIVGGNDGDAFIAFATDEDARKAMLLDRQAINGAPVRLFLSSKAEMQSVIDSARSSALFGIPAAQSSTSAVSQKTETMQALDVTAPTLPSSFPSYRNGAVREPYPNEAPSDPYAYTQNRQGSSPQNTSVGLARQQRSETYGEDNLRPRIPERPVPPDPSRDRDYEFTRQSSQFVRQDGLRDRPPVSGDFGVQPRDAGSYENPRMSPHVYRNQSNEPVYDRRPPDGHYPPRPRDGPRDEVRIPYAESRFGRPPDPPVEYDRERSPRAPPPDRFPHHEPRDPRGAPDQPLAFPYDRRPNSSHSYERDPQFSLARAHERDFSIRPPWLNDEGPPGGPKRHFPGPPEFDDYARKRRPPPPARPLPDNHLNSETDWVVRLTLPITDVGIKAIFEILRGVHIVAKWGIRIEEDALQRPTGYVFIMMTGRDSFDRALTFDGRQFKGKPVKVIPSSLDEFYKVTDSNFHLKCPPEIAKKLPTSDQPVSPPHHADGCLEIAELPPDTTKAEIVRFLGAPGLTVSDVTISNFPPSDKSASKTPGSVRALVSLPSSKDIAILLSAKPRPLRPDGAFPPVRLTPISRLQLETYGALPVDDKSKSEPSGKNQVTAESPKSATSNPLTCAYLSGLGNYLKDSEVLRLFPSVLIPGDAIRMVGPSNTSAYIDFISENNCRRAIADINGNDSKAKHAHPNIRIEPISREEMENRLGSSHKMDDSTSITEHRPTSRPTRDRDPRELARPPWDNRSLPPRNGRHQSPAAPFRPRSPHNQPPCRGKFDEPYYEQHVLPPFDDSRRMDPFNEVPRRPRPPMDTQHSLPLPPHPPGDYMLPPARLTEPPLPPPRRPVADFVTVHIGNLPPTITVDQIAGIMRDYYFIPGSIRLRRDIQGIPTGDGLVDFNSTYDGDRAIRDLNGYRISGRSLMLQYDRRP